MSACELRRVCGIEIDWAATVKNFEFLKMQVSTLGDFGPEAYISYTWLYVFMIIVSSSYVLIESESFWSTVLGRMCLQSVPLHTIPFDSVHLWTMLSYKWTVTSHYCVEEKQVWSLGNWLNISVARRPFANSNSNSKSVKWIVWAKASDLILQLDIFVISVGACKLEKRNCGNSSVLCVSI